MMESFNILHLIKQWLFDEIDRVQDFIPGFSMAYFVRRTDFEQFKTFCRNHVGLRLEPNSWDYDLKFNEFNIEVRLIFLTLESNEALEFMREQINSAKLAFPWGDQSTEDFRDNIIEYIPANVHIAFAFPWLQPKKLQYFEIPIDTRRICSNIPTILDYLSDELNLFDLLKIKLAFCNPLDPDSTISIENEIDYRVHKSLQKMVANQTYIEENHFDLMKYAFDKNFAPADVFYLLPYFQYEFQEYFSSVESPENIVTPYISATIKLVDERMDDVLMKIHQKHEVKFTIDGSQFEGITFPYFLNLLQCQNVVKIILDTNYRLAEATEPIYSLTDFNHLVEVQFIGSNLFNLMDELIVCIKSISFPANAREYFDLVVECCPSSYMIFGEVEARQLIFRDTLITSNLLEELTDCNIKLAHIRFVGCTFVNRIENWRLLNNLEALQHVIIHEDNGTWQCIFEFIQSELTLGRTEFQFNHWITIVCENKKVNLQRIKFTFDESNSTLRLEDLYNSNAVIDLYELKNNLEVGDRSDFDFYQ